jgi:hypothetical protein
MCQPEALAMTQHKFKVKLMGQAGSEVAALKPPFDVVEVFQRKGRVPVKGTIDGFPFRSSLMNMGDGHMMVVNASCAPALNAKLVILSLCSWSSMRTSGRSRFPRT